MGIDTSEAKVRYKDKRRQPAPNEIHKVKSSKNKRKPYVLEINWGPDRVFWKEGWYPRGHYATERALKNAFTVCNKTGKFWGLTCTARMVYPDGTVKYKIE